MKAKLCNDCVYTPEDLAYNYDPNAATFCCGRCPAQGLQCYAQGPYYRDRVIHPERTNYVKRHGGEHGNETTVLV